MKEHTRWWPAAWTAFACLIIVGLLAIPVIPFLLGGPPYSCDMTVDDLLKEGGQTVSWLTKYSADVSSGWCDDSDPIPALRYPIDPMAADAILSEARSRGWKDVERILLFKDSRGRAYQLYVTNDQYTFDVTNNRYMLENQTCVYVEFLG